MYSGTGVNYFIGLPWRNGPDKISAHHIRHACKTETLQSPTGFEGHLQCLNVVGFENMLDMPPSHALEKEKAPHPKK